MLVELHLSSRRVNLRGSGPPGIELDVPSGLAIIGPPSFRLGTVVCR